MSLVHTIANTEKFSFKSICERVDVYTEQQKETRNEFAEDIITGLNHSPKYLLPKYFYDSKGSELFEQITRLKEYYPTKVERSIIKSVAPVLPELAKNISAIIEIGSGSSNKTQLFLDSFCKYRDRVTYIPLDISDIIIEVSRSLAGKFENIFITGINSEYFTGLNLAVGLHEEPKLYLFLGSSIGNFTYDKSIEFLSFINSIMHEDDLLLIGFDRIKDRHILKNAYDDSQGITAKFNLNILDRINQEFNANFNPDNFDHKIKFNEEQSRIEMHLVSNKLQSILLKKLDLQIHLQAGESIHTENSYKYSDSMISNLAQDSGFNIVENFKDDREYFSLCLFRKIK